MYTLQHQDYPTKNRILSKVVSNWLYLEIIWKQESDLSNLIEVYCCSLEYPVQYDKDAVW